MARESTITFEQVAAAADSIKAEGRKPTSRAVREVLGVGSMATVLKFMQQWQGGQARQSQAIDDTIDPGIVRAISGQIAAKVQEATAEATARLADLQAETDLLIAENERQSTELEEAAQNSAMLTKQVSASTGRIQQLEAEVLKQTAELAQERAAAEAARVALAKAELRLESVPRIEAELVAVRAELATERNSATAQHEAAAVAIARFEAEAEKCKALDARLADAKAAATEVSKRATAAQESTERQLEAAKADTKKALLEAAELRGQLTELSKPKPVAPAKPAKSKPSART